MTQQQLLRKILQPGDRKIRMYGSWMALCLGVLLLFLSLIAWMDFRELLSGRNGSDSMAEYLIIGKMIGDHNAGRKMSGNLFAPSEIKALLEAKGVQEVGALSSNRFPVTADVGASMGFSTELFLESVDDRFLDVLPQQWFWKPGDPALPVILSNEFLNLYNYGFALSQGFPQLSPKNIQSIPFRITVAGKEQYAARIVGFTDRISSVLVPQNFMDAMNSAYGSSKDGAPSRLILKVKDPSDADFINFLKSRQYNVNQDQLRWSRIRTVVQAIVATVGGVALVVVAMAVLAFILFVEITVQRGARSIRLLMQIGYAPDRLSRAIYRFFLPWIGSAVIFALGLAVLLHLALLHWLNTMDLKVSPIAAWPVTILAIAILIMMGGLLMGSVKKMMGKV